MIGCERPRIGSDRSSRNLVMMAFQVDTSFPDAVDAIGDLIVPYELDLLVHSLLLQHEPFVAEHRV